ncbi:TPA: peptide chain release factor-like protein, partial [Candidatus Sumerlaeota bacterium]|nr:peptide chain release factor-like protein [Candidatus Sumerlaeota bacterium]
LARARLIEALEEQRRERLARERAEREKTRRRPRPRPAGVKRRMVDSKKKRGAVKKLRGRVE